MDLWLRRPPDIRSPFAGQSVRHQRRIPRQPARTTFTGYFGHTQGLAAMEQIYPAGKNGDFGYVEAAFQVLEREQTV